MSTSPKPKAKPIVLINFYDALRECAGGKKIHKQEWPDGEYAFMKNEMLTIHKLTNTNVNNTPIGQDHNWIVQKADLDGEDYVVGA